jgi:hypothetical protein
VVWWLVRLNTQRDGLRAACLSFNTRMRGVAPLRGVSCHLRDTVTIKEWNLILSKNKDSLPTPAFHFNDFLGPALFDTGSSLSGGFQGRNEWLRLYLFLLPHCYLRGTPMLHTKVSNEKPTIGGISFDSMRPAQGVWIQISGLGHEECRGLDDLASHTHRLNM